MQVEVKGRNLQVTDELRALCAKRFDTIGKQVSELAVLQVELFQERNPANPIRNVAEVTLHLKGTTLRAREAAREMPHAINLVAEDVARQVKRHRDKRSGRRDGRTVADLILPPEAPGEAAAPAA